MRRKSAATLVEAAQKSVGIDGGACAKMELQLLLEDYYAKQEQLRKMTEVLEAETLKVQNVKKLLAVKGIGLITVAGFLAEVGEIGRFDPQNRPGSRPDWNMYPLFQRTHNPQTATGNKLGNNIDQIMIRRRKIERFIESVKDLPEPITEFDESLWAGLVDSMSVHSKDRIVWKLTCGMEIES